MEQNNEAGKLLLLQLKTVNEAAAYLEQVIIPEFWRGLDACTNAFTCQYDWKYDCNIENEDMWLAPKSWQLDEQTKNWSLRFESKCTDESSDHDYLFAVMTGVGTQPGEWGFVSRINMAECGGSRKANTAIKSIDNDFIARMHELDFRYLGKGEFFLPVKFDSTLLSETWMTYGEFPEQDDAFEPLRVALEKLRSAAPILDDFMKALASKLSQS
ncbi:hypothetical protein [Serratia sp. DD3]|uniref:hypothetical protein n=1 Tax=Serratia sp. DD3 TaxID=1410619 RepID=UPI0003C511CF|nr:hypothetical protein [Serratia sp. DD3]KEY59850.1 hypothetical protein SRDD_11890 [Serratia sp. DD3]